MGSSQAKNVALANMVVGGLVLIFVAVLLFMGLVADNLAIFSFLSGASCLFYGFTVYRALTDGEADQTTFYGLRKRAGSSWLVPALMTAAPLVTEHALQPTVFATGICAVAASVLLDVCLHNGSKGR